MKRKFLIVRFSSLGDIILTTACILNLKINFPDCHIVFLTKECFRDLVATFGGVDEIVCLSEENGVLGYYQLLNKLDDYHFDTVIDLHGNFRSWLAGKMVTANRKIVYPKRRLERLDIVRKKQIPQSWPHTIDLYNKVVEPLGGKVYCRRPVIKTTRRKKINSLVFDRSISYVFFAPGAAHSNKQWGLDNFSEVALELHRRLNCRIIWSVLSPDMGQSRLEKQLPPEAFFELVDYPVDELMEIISQSRLTVANDSGLAHLSSAVGTPTLAVFGPTHPSLGFSPRGLFDRVIEVAEPCRPCSLHGKKPCYRDKRYCFTRIEPAMVLDAALKILQSGINVHPALFVDRDGTIIVDKDYLSDPDKIEFEPGAIEALKLAGDKGYKVVVISNQSGVARGLFGLDSVERVNTRFMEMLSARGVEINALYYCPHYPEGKVSEFSFMCDCRKPAPGMVEEAAKALGIDIRRSFVIGDTLKDYNLGRVLGVETFIVRTGYGQKTEQKLKIAGKNNKDFTFDNLLQAVKHIVRLPSYD
ncbi:MAG: HAD-IIIA family hydrolase [candidate division Zixibacteria bacterium]|nr:HAD-IIIA family hydrolase [candidate division Zixibacteria bacterium]